MDRLTEFLADPNKSRITKVLAVIDFSGGGPLRVSEIEEASVEAGLRAVKQWNVSQMLKRTDGAATLLPEGWKLTAAGKILLTEDGWKTQTSDVVNLIEDLNVAIAKIKNEDRRSFVREATNCFAANHYRASVVLSWSGAVAVMHDYVLANLLASFSEEAKRQNLTKRDISKTSDLQELKDHSFLQIAYSIGMIDKNQKQELESRRQFRNACGHPSALKLSSRMVSAHLESLLLNVFEKF